MIHDLLRSFGLHNPFVVGHFVDPYFSYKKKKSHFALYKENGSDLTHYVGTV